MCSSHSDSAHLLVQDGVGAGREHGANIVGVGGARLVDVDQVVGRAGRAAGQKLVLNITEGRLVIRL